jgi:hypothetical protein
MTTSDPDAEDPDYDGAWRKLLEQPALLLTLLRLCFPIHPPLAQARARPLNTTFLTQSLQRKHADCIWEIPLGGHPGHSVFVLVEFQSSVDPTMAARMNSYAALLHLHLTDTRPRARRWPPLLLPLVIYNGQPRWSAPIRLQEPPALPSWPALAHFQLHSAFHLLDLGHDELPSPESQPDNLALTLLHMEQASLQRHTERVGDLFDILQRQLEHHPPGACAAARFPYLLPRGLDPPGRHPHHTALRVFAGGKNHVRDLC